MSSAFSIAGRAPTHHGTVVRMAVALAFGLAPVATFVLTLPVDGLVSTGQFWTKALALPTLAAQGLTIGLAATLAPGFAIRLPIWMQAALASLGAIAIGTIWFAPEPVFAALRTGLWIIHILFAAAVARLCAAGLVRPAELISAMALGLCALMPLTMGYALSAPNPAQLDWINGLPGFDNIRRIGYYAAPIGALAIGQIALCQGGRARITWVAMLALAVTFTAWSGSRGGLVALGGAMVVGAFFFPTLRRPATLLPVAAGGLGGAVIALAIPAPDDAMSFRRMMDAGSSSSGRAALWRDTLDAALMRPWFGHGEGQTYAAVPIARSYEVLHPHNLPLQLLLAWGIVGTLLALAIALGLGRHILFDAREANSRSLPWSLAMAALLVFSLYDGTLFHVQASATFFLCLGMTLRTGAKTAA